MVAGVAVVALNGNGMLFTDNVSFMRQYFGESVPSIGIEYAVFEVRDFVVKSSECLGIPFAKYPSNGASRFAIYGFDKPKLVGLLLNEMPHFIEFNFLYFIGYFSFMESVSRLAYPIIDYRRPGFEDFRQHVERCFTEGVKQDA